MKMMKIVVTLLIVALIAFLYTTPALAGFDWGDSDGSGSGSGSFEQQIAENDIVEVGEIPSGKEGIYIKLTSDDDVDIQLYDKDSEEKIVHWPDGILSGSSFQSTNYHGVTIEWSGYNGDGTGLGHEYIRIIGTTNRPLVMKAFGYQPGYAIVEYSWTGTEDGTPSSGPDQSGSGTFQQQITLSDTVEVGKLIPGLSSVYIELVSDKDVDIQLYDGNTKIVHWPDGILSGSSTQSTNYNGMTIEWSGYNGAGTGKGHEYIRIEGTINRTLTMKAYGYAAGYATINYIWGYDLESITKEGTYDYVEENGYIYHIFEYTHSQMEEISKGPYKARPYANYMIDTIWTLAEGRGSTIGKTIGSIWLAFKLDWQADEELAAGHTIMYMVIKSRTDEHGKWALEFLDKSATIWKKVVDLIK